MSDFFSKDFGTSMTMAFKTVETISMILHNKKLSFQVSLHYLWTKALMLMYYPGLSEFTKADLNIHITHRSLASTLMKHLFKHLFVISQNYGSLSFGILHIFESCVKFLRTQAQGSEIFQNMHDVSFRVYSTAN